MSLGVTVRSIVGHAGSVGRTPTDVFTDIYVVFLVLGTLVGVVVIGYTLYNAVKYRDGGTDDETAETPEKVVRPSLGELPESSGGGRKLFVSFTISAVIVVSLILWTYSALLYVDAGAAPATDGDGGETNIEGLNDEGVLEIDVVGQQFSWIFVYPNGYESTTLHVPKDVPVKLNVTSTDVMHNIGIPEFNAKTDAIPGQTTTTWFVPDKTGTYKANCYELCGSGHSVMTSDVVVMEPGEYQEWYDETAQSEGQNETGGQNTTDGQNETGSQNGTDGQSGSADQSETGGQNSTGGTATEQESLAPVASVTLPLGGEA